MALQVDRASVRKRIHRRIRVKISGTAERPRLCVRRTLKHVYLQAVDDQSGNTVCAASTLEQEFRSKMARGGNIAAARVLGELMAQRLKEKGIERVVFDRGGKLYHGRVQAVAEAARKQGLQF
jgi:large subunit ribosomal protein L18